MKAAQVAGYTSDVSSRPQNRNQTIAASLVALLAVGTVAVFFTVPASDTGRRFINALIFVCAAGLLAAAFQMVLVFVGAAKALRRRS